jgi:hypothetical protein
MFATLTRTTIDSQVKSLRQLAQSQTSNTQSLLLLNAQAKNIVSLVPFKRTPKDKLAALSNIFSDKITISQWEFDDSSQQFKITGTAATRDDLLKLKDNLDKSDDFAKVILPLGTLETPVQVPFVITFLVKQ